MALKGLIPVFGTTYLEVPRQGLRFHNIPDFLAQAQLDRDLNFLFGPGWYALLLKMGGGGAFAGHSHNTEVPPDDVLQKMLDVSKKLNRDLHHDGHWVVVWHRMKRLCLIWRDNDGALQFEIGCSDPWGRVQKWSDDDFAERAEAAWLEWAVRMEIVDVRPEQQTIKPTPTGGGPFLPS